VPACESFEIKACDKSLPRVFGVAEGSGCDGGDGGGGGGGDLNAGKSLGGFGGTCVT